MKRIIRHSPALFWTILEQASFTGISRLVLFPVVAHLVGKNEFGLFATALSFVLIVGVQPGNGLAMGLLRNLSEYKGQLQGQLTSTAIRMCHRFLLIFLCGVLAVLIGIVAFGLINTRTFLCLTFLAISLYAENLFMLILTPLRYRRLFREHALWYVGSALCVLVFGIAGTYLAGIVGLAFGMMSANFIVCGMVTKKYFEPDLHYDAEQAKALRWIWLHLTIAGVLVLAGPHLNRIVLSFYWDHESVADLFAATGMVHIFVFPISNLRKLLLSMISRYKTIDQISVSVFISLLGLMVGGAILGMFIFSLGAPILLKLLFPGFGDRALGLISILIWMIPANIAIVFSRPFITKFANIAWIPRINFAVLSVTLILMFSLIPRWGLDGAAWSITFKSIISTLLHGIIFCVIYRQSKRLPDITQVNKQNEALPDNGVILKDEVNP